MFIFKIYYVIKDVNNRGKIKRIYDFDLFFSILVCFFDYLIIAAYAFLLHKFLLLIKQNNGYLNFMKFQVVFFFTFIIVLLVLKSAGHIMIPIEYDAIMDASKKKEEILSPTEISEIQISFYI